MFEIGATTKIRHLFTLFGLNPEKKTPNPKNEISRKQLNDSVFVYLDNYQLSTRGHTLKDRSKIKWGDKIASIDILPAPMKPDENGVSYSIKLLNDLKKALEQLAILCNEDPTFKDVKFIGGATSTIPQHYIDRLGFNIFLIDDDELRSAFFTRTEEVISKTTADNTHIPKRKLHLPYEIWISRQELQQRYGQKNFTPLT